MVYGFACASVDLGWVRSHVREFLRNYHPIFQALGLMPPNPASFTPRGADPHAGPEPVEHAFKEEHVLEYEPEHDYEPE